jgi:hypothetical protein
MVAPNDKCLGFLIIALAFFDKAKAQWALTVDLSWRSAAHRRSHITSDSSKSFQTKTEAENFGVEIDRAWVDEWR